MPDIEELSPLTVNSVTSVTADLPSLPLQGYYNINVINGDGTQIIRGAFEYYESDTVQADFSFQAQNGDVPRTVQFYISINRYITGLLWTSGTEK